MNAMPIAIPNILTFKAVIYRIPKVFSIYFSTRMRFEFQIGQSQMALEHL